MSRGYAPNWDLDLAYGEQGETTVAELLGLHGSRIEVKRKRYVDDRFFVELKQSPGASGHYQLSGLNTTKADYFAYLIADTGVVVLVPTSYLRTRLAHALG